MLVAGFWLLAARKFNKFWRFMAFAYSILKYFDFDFSE